MIPGLYVCLLLLHCWYICMYDSSSCCQPYKSHYLVSTIGGWFTFLLPSKSHYLVSARPRWVLSIGSSPGFKELHHFTFMIGESLSLNPLYNWWHSVTLSAVFYHLQSEIFTKDKLNNHNKVKHHEELHGIKWSSLFLNIFIKFRKFIHSLIIQEIIYLA